jgi:Protein of unknown function (DUF2851)
MTEQLFQFIWQYKLFDVNKITQTSNGESITILSVGTLNTDAGPDFTNAKIKIGETTWAGDVELHIKASDWLRHQHQHQASYQKVILHVVLENDKVILDSLGNQMPTIELKDAIPLAYVEKYETLMANTKHLACHTQIAQVREITVLQQLDNVMIERLIAKSERIQALLQETNNDWNEVFYISIARAFGTGVNSDSFQALASRIPLKVLSKQKNNLLQLEAMLFGVSGLMPSKNDHDYFVQLQQEFHLLKTKFGLMPMDPTRFKFSKMRPANFPTIRIAQFASLIHNAHQLLSKVLEACADVNALVKLFNAQASGFWQQHFTFGDDAHEVATKSLGKTSVHGILINTVCPMLFQYGKYMGEQKFCDAAIQILQQIPAEKNKYTNIFSEINYTPSNALQSQAMIQQYLHYCAPKKCLQCAIGFRLMKLQ